MEEDEERSGVVAPREDDHSNEDKLDQSLVEPLDSQVSEDVGVVVLPEMDDSELVNGFPIDAVEEEVALASEEGAPTVAAAEEVVSAEEVETEVEAMGTEAEAVETEAEAMGTEAEAVETEAEAVETEAEAMETEAEAVETEAEAADANGSGGKRKRGRPAKGQAKSPSSAKRKEKEKGEEDVCFICFDGGNLVLCDRRGCPKAYHPSCVNRDEAFFRSKGRWNCGWHICSNCEKGARFMCYTCTYSLCKGCMKESEFFCIRGNRGLCETCMRTVTLIEKSEHENKEMAQIDFNDKNSWEYLFKEYWMDLKGKLLLTSDEIAQAKNPLKGSGMPVQKEESSDELYDGNGDRDSHSDSSAGHTEVINPKKRKLKKRSKAIKGDSVSNDLRKVGTKGKATSNENEWASKELLDLVAHMKNGDTSMLSQFDVQALLLEYIKQNSLRDPRRKSQIVCDTRLEKLFGKPRVGHFEMLKLIELHFLVKEETLADDIQEDVSKESNQLDADANNDALPKVGTDKRRKTKKRGERAFQTNLDDYAAVDVHNINLLYLRRNLMEDLLEDGEKFHDKVVGSFVRIRISGAAQKQDMYRLVQVVGTRKAQEPYKTGKRSTDVLLEILNLNKTEAITIDIISNQAFTEDECKRLRQSIKCGLIGRMTVGEVQDKALALQEVRVKDWLETEKARLSHLRDRASETGRRKELRECVEKLELLNKTEERQRRLQEIPEVHDDPNMDPNHESEEDEGEQDDKKQDYFNRQREAGLSRKVREPISPGKGSPVAVTWSGARKSPSATWESSRNVPAKGAWEKGGSGDRTVDSLRSEGTDPHQSDSWGSIRTNHIQLVQTLVLGVVKMF
ncbi:hypothetical protein Syun_005193 [Stephania yunnanensis]|uniref:Zinc finger CCCH domain-containing protein 19 n=1 Tax=Stephania yunnanensis TaxID=152371 RepID=A0AAP0Q5P2_9MAGN